MGGLGATKQYVSVCIPRIRATDIIIVGRSILTSLRLASAIKKPSSSSLLVPVPQALPFPYRRPRSSTRCPLSLYCGQPHAARPHACFAILTLQVQAPGTKEASPILRPSPSVLVPSHRLGRDKQIRPRLKFPPLGITKKVLRSSRLGMNNAPASLPEHRQLRRIWVSHADFEGLAQIREGIRWCPRRL